MQIQVKTLWLLYYFKGKELSKNREKEKEKVLRQKITERQQF